MRNAVAVVTLLLAGCGADGMDSGHRSMEERQSMFRTITEDFLASPQIGLDQIADAKAAGVTLIVNNRPDGEEPDAPQGDAVEAAARAADLDYVAIPVSHAGFSHAQIDALTTALDGAKGKVLAYCRSGTRSTLLWSLAQAKAGRPVDEIARLAMNAGYDVTPIRPLLDTLAGGGQ